MTDRDADTKYVDCIAIVPEGLSDWLVLPLHTQRGMQTLRDMLVNGEPDEQYDVEYRRMTWDEFNALEDHRGF